MARKVLLGEAILNRGGTVKIPDNVVEALDLMPKPGERSKLLWTPVGDEVIVSKGTPTSDWRKSMFRKNGTAAIPRHIQKALKLKSPSMNQEHVLWIWKEEKVVLRRRTPS
jgi:hypothetical protein